MRCAVYVRVSTDMETQKTSIVHQISFFEKYIENKGWDLYKIYRDIESGRSVKNRDGLQELIKESKEKKFDTVLTKSISRFARNTLEGLMIIRDFKANNIRFVTIEDGFDSKEYDEFMFTLLLSIAQKESEKMSERIKFGKLCRAKRGYYNGSNPPYGYKKINKYKIVPAEDTSTYVVKEIFAMYLEGKGIYKIAKELNDKGCPTPSQVAGKRNSGFLWHQSTIRKILSNEFYVGDMIQNKSVTVNVLTGERKENKEPISIRNTHEGIIDLITFEEVQKKLKEKKKKKAGIQEHLFSNLLVCGECGSRMHYKKDKEAYICGKLNKMGKKHCKGAYIKERILEEMVRKELKKMIYENINKTVFLEEIEKEIKKGDSIEKIGELKNSIEKLYHKKIRIFDMLMDDLVDEEIYLKKLKEFEGQESILKENIEKILKKTGNNEGYWRLEIDKIFAVEELDIMILNKLIKRIKILKDKEVAIAYRFRL